MTYEEYKEKVMEEFKIISNYSDSEIIRYFELESTIEVLYEDYLTTQGDNIAGISHYSTAYCLWMLYYVE